MQGRAGSDSGPHCGKKQASIPNCTLSTTALPILHTCKILSLTQGQREPWSSLSSRPVLVTPYTQSAAQTPPQPLQPIPQSIVCPMGQPRLWSLDTRTLVHLVLNITRTQSILSHLPPHHTPSLSPTITLCGSIPARHIPTLTHHTPCHVTSPHTPDSQSWCALTRAAHFSHFSGDLL